MEDPKAVDDALELAIERTIAAQDRFETTPLSAPEILPVADTVVHRADDLRVLAKEADSAIGAHDSGREGRSGSSG